MQTFPVFATIVAAYRFLVRELPTIVRLTWAPLAIVAIIQYLSAHHVLGDMATILASGDATAGAAQGRYTGWVVFTAVLEILGTAVVAVALHELILFGERKPGTYLYVSFGARELRFVLLALAFGVGTVALVLLPLFTAGTALKGYLSLVTIVTIIVAIYLSIRLWPIFPIIVVTNEVKIADAWALTRGRFWSLAALGLVGMLPTVVAVGVINTVLPDFDAVASATASLAEKRRMVETAQTWLPLRAILDFALSIFNAAIGVALISYGYKALTGHQFEERLTPIAVAGE